MRVIKSVKEMQALSRKVKERGQKIAFVPTMGALHDGHLHLVEEAHKHGDVVVVSIFVNPTQFAPSEDLSRYPRNIAKDKTLLKMFEPLVIFHPSPTDIYLPNFGTWVEEEPLSKKLCGKFRLGHFKGVTTIVAKLFNIVAPDVALFGAKDYQQQLIVKKLVKDLSYPIQIVIIPTAREYDGLAMSSRNTYLTEHERKAAGMIYKALIRAKKDIEGGDRDCSRILLNMRRLLGFEPIIRIDYINLLNPETLEDIKDLKGKILIAIAVRIHKTRLIDNIIVSV